MLLSSVPSWARLEAYEWVAFGALLLKQRLGLTNEDTVQQIRENVYMQFPTGLPGYSKKATFGKSTIFYCRTRFTDGDLKPINELIVERGKATVR